MGAEEQVKLTLKTAGFDAMRGIASDAQDAASTYQVLAKAGEGFELEERRVADAMDGAVAAAVERTRAQRALNAALEEAAPAASKSAGGADKAAKSTMQLGGAFQTTAFAAQDFASQLGTRGLGGAIGAVQNNIPTLVTQIGGKSAAGLAGAIGIATVAAGLLYDNWDKVAAFWSPAEVAKLPTLGEGLDGIAKSLKGINKEIEALEEKSLSDVLSVPELDRLRALRGLKETGEKDQADLRLVEGVGTFDDKRSREIAAAVKAAIAESGGGESVASNLKENAGGSYQEAVAVVAGAMRGNTADLATLRKMAPTFAREYRSVDPDALRAQKKAQEDFKREQDLQAARIKKNDDLVDGLNEQGAKDEAAWRAENDRDERKAKAQAERDRAKADRAATAGARLDAFHDQAFENAAGLAIAENGGEFSPAQLQSIAREAANNAQGLDVDSIRQAVYQAAFMTRQRLQSQLMRQMGRLQVGTDAFNDF